jgi:hypothetical protein
VSTVLRFAVCAGVLGAAFTGLSLCQMRSSDGPEAQAGSLPSFLTELEQEQERGRALEVELRQVLARFEFRREALDNLLAGRLTLREAAARFGAVNRELPEGARLALRDHFAGATDEERCYRQVMAAAEYRFLDHPATAKVVRARMLREYQALREAGPFAHPE